MAKTKWYKDKLSYKKMQEQKFISELFVKNFALQIIYGRNNNE